MFFSSSGKPNLKKCVNFHHEIFGLTNFVLDLGVCTACCTVFCKHVQDKFFYDFFKHTMIFFIFFLSKLIKKNSKISQI